ncbi:MAG: hypothetical protein E7578_08645 [Ruminococcaceae bacterium]|nr:hypothetical protein [Oscillospiraceae bacterium]
MKKIVSAILILTIMLCSMAVSASADGVLYMDADFSSEENFARDFFPEAYTVYDDCAVGYSEARALQTTGRWAAYDVSFDVTFGVDELVPDGSGRSLSFVYFNNNIVYKGLSDERMTISVCFDVSNSEVSLVANDFVKSESCEVLAASVPFEIEDGKEYHLGVSINEQHIRVFSDSTLLIDYYDTENKYYIGYTFEEVEPEILVWWNNNNYLMYSDIKVSSPEYLYPPTPVSDNTGAVDGTTAPVVTTTATSVVDVTDDKGNVMTDDSGNKITETVIITDAPVADTNTGAVQGGSSTNTGDMTFIVVAAMVAAIGCALIVRKVGSR